MATIELQALTLDQADGEGLGGPVQEGHCGFMKPSQICQLGSSLGVPSMCPGAGVVNWWSEKAERLVTAALEDPESTPLLYRSYRFNCLILFFLSRRMSSLSI